jgi:uncharacterized pyridoxamine 5'-phosphate oxidase family protein
MPGYGIAGAKDGKGLLRWSWARERLTRTQNYFLTTVREDGRPHVMPVWGVCIDDVFYFSTGETSVKGRNLKTNPNCVVCPGDADEAVILEGKAQRVTNRTVIKKFAAAYLKKYKFDITTMDSPIYAVHPHVVFGEIEKSYTQTATRWKF